MKICPVKIKVTVKLCDLSEKLLEREGDASVLYPSLIL